jgi:phospholipase/carboxylesterase
VELLPRLEVAPRGGEVRASVIWLHGLGADGHDFEPIVPHLGLDPALGVRFVFPHAPSVPVTLNGGMVMPAWYDLALGDGGFRHDEVGIRRSAAQLSDLIAHENDRGVPCERIVLAGFSQGGAIALFQGLRHAEPLAGLMALSTYLVLHEHLETERSEANLAVPIFQAHGTLDPMVQIVRGTESRDRLQALGYAVQWHEYPMQHQVCMEEIEAAGRWLNGVLAQD